ncbi:major facilitator superfamily domain-containing protein [Amylocarpus encephaloides]|uniref:Major facilitator superfamily domain-containing protein n=1 Tax=Amylocarpus encephaloides TaxID=45428 RepID=A0A9P8C9V4_9HELO|nr:major facilitator superfamily domain-containing protein [Amylocarpus encephaloides]
MSERSLKTARIVSSIAATCISLACGTNYVYSAWGPQFADRLKLSSTDQNLIGLSANLGMYSMGIPIGMFVDAKNPRIAVMAGALLLAAGYFPLHQAYDSASGWMPLLCFFSYLSGLGGCAAFAASIKTSALNWPHHRGTATGFPLAAFGLSAFFFSMLSQFIPGNTGHFLLVLACGTFGLVFISFFFLQVLPPPQYAAVPRGAGATNRLHRTKSEDIKYQAERGLLEPEPGAVAPEDEPLSETDEISSLMSRDSSSPGVEVESEENNVKDHAHLVDIRGFQLLPLIEFWQLFALMGILTGIGLMTINNIGNDVKALWMHFDDSATPYFIAKRQAMHVSILSVCSFIGRLLSGVGSDFLVKVLKASRLWCLTLASLIFLIAQLAAYNITVPQHLVFVSSLTGLAYGFLFGCFPSIVAEAFGVYGLSQNWGCMTLSPVISGNVFNIFYGKVFDKHSIVNGAKERICTEGLECYRTAYLVTIAACVLGLVVSLWTIRHTHQARLEEKKAREIEEREA